MTGQLVFEFIRIIEEVKPTHLITKETIQHKDELLYRMCKSLGIKILMLSQPGIGYKCIISSAKPIAGWMCVRNFKLFAEYPISSSSSLLAHISGLSFLSNFPAGSSIISS